MPWNLSCDFSVKQWAQTCCVSVQQGNSVTAPEAAVQGH